MERLISAFILGFFAMFPVGQSAAEDLAKRQSPFSVAETMDRFQAKVEGRGLPILLRINHGREGNEAGVALRPVEIAIFGAVEPSARFIARNGAIGIDMPLRLVVWEEEDGSVWAGAISADAFAERWGLPKDDPQIQRMRMAVDSLLTMATSEGG